MVLACFRERQEQEEDREIRGYWGLEEKTGTYGHGPVQPSKKVMGWEGLEEGGPLSQDIVTGSRGDCPRRVVVVVIHGREVLLWQVRKVCQRGRGEGALKRRFVSKPIECPFPWVLLVAGATLTSYRNKHDTSSVTAGGPGYPPTPSLAWPSLAWSGGRRKHCEARRNTAGLSKRGRSLARQDGGRASRMPFGGAWPPSPAAAAAAAVATTAPSRVRMAWNRTRYGPAPCGEPSVSPSLQAGAQGSAGARSRAPGTAGLVVEAGVGGGGGGRPLSGESRAVPRPGEVDEEVAVSRNRIAFFFICFTARPPEGGAGEANEAGAEAETAADDDDDDDEAAGGPGPARLRGGCEAQRPLSSTVPTMKTVSRS